MKKRKGIKSYYDEKLIKKAEALGPVSPVINYPTRKTGRLITRRHHFSLLPSDKALAPDHPGSADWAANEMFKGKEDFVRWAESTIADKERETDREKAVFEFCLLYREWERKWKLEVFDKEPTLNQACYALQIRASDMVRLIVEGVREMLREIGRVKASMAIPRVMAAMEEAAMRPEGVKDREMLVKIAGVIEEHSGVQVNVNQQQAVVGPLTGAERERLKTPLLQFADTIEKMDDEVRGWADQRMQVVEAEVIEDEERTNRTDG